MSPVRSHYPLPPAHREKGDEKLDSDLSAILVASLYRRGDSGNRHRQTGAFTITLPALSNTEDTTAGKKTFALGWWPDHGRPTILVTCSFPWR